MTGRVVILLLIMMTLTFTTPMPAQAGDIEDFFKKIGEGIEKFFNSAKEFVVKAVNWVQDTLNSILGTTGSTSPSRPGAPSGQAPVNSGSWGSTSSTSSSGSNSGKPWQQPPAPPKGTWDGRTPWQTPPNSSGNSGNNNNSSTATSGSKNIFEVIEGFFGNISTQAEKELGNQAAMEIEKKNNLCLDPVMLKRLVTIGKRVASRCERKELDYTFKIIDSSDVNAFALPGGHVYVTKGLLQQLNDDDELAGVLGHELAHINRRHGIKQMQKAGLMNLALQLITGQIDDRNGRKAAEISGAIAQFFLTMKFSRDNEFEADRIGMCYAVQAGYRPDGLISFLEKLAKKEKNSLGEFGKYLSTHPPAKERSEALWKFLSENPGAVFGDTLNGRKPGRIGQIPDNRGIDTESAGTVFVTPTGTISENNGPELERLREILQNNEIIKIR